MSIEVKIPEPLADAAKDMIQKVIVPPLEQIGGLLADPIRYWRFKNQVNIVCKADEYLKSRNMKTRKVSLGVLAPLLDECSLEDDEDIQQKWAALFINTVKEDSGINNALYSHILGQLSKNDAEILRAIHGKTFHNNPSKEHVTTILASTLDDKLPDVMLSIDNLLRLRLIFQDNPFSWVPVNVAVTELGKRFIEVCTLP